MWWFFKKKVDNDECVIYEYGKETKELSGEIKYDKKENDFVCMKIADNDTIKVCERFVFPHLYRIIFKENAPNERQVAIG